MPIAATAVDHEHRVTPRELFFDLVFVFAFTQVATLLADDPTFAGIGRGVLVLAALWWAWAAYAWLTNVVDPEEGVIGAALLVALIAMFVAALVVPGVFEDDGVLFGAAFVVVCAMHVGVYALAGRGSPDLLGAVLRLAPWALGGATLILVAGFTDGARIWLWLAALGVTYAGGVLTGSAGWRLHPSHFAERYGLVLIIALGEAFISIGIGDEDDRRGRRRRARRRCSRCTLRRELALPPHVLGDSFAARAPSEIEPRAFYRGDRLSRRPSARDAGPGPRGAGRRDRRVGGVAHV